MKSENENVKIREVMCVEGIAKCIREITRGSIVRLFNDK